MDHVFVVTYGRSGSTVLLNLLNQIDGYCIRGENAGTLNALAVAAMRARDSRTDFGAEPRKPTHPWHGADCIDHEEFTHLLAHAFTKTVINPPTGTRVCGFKEVRFNRNWLSDREFQAVIDFLLTAFSNAKVIFNTRDAEEVLQSGWWKKQDPDKVREFVRHTDGLFREANKRHGAQTLMIDYSSFKAGAAGLKSIIDWLGEEVDDGLIEAVAGKRLMHLQSKTEPERFFEKYKKKFINRL